MAAWPERLDHFLGYYPHVIAALEAISTFAAVVVSLSLAFAAGRSSKTRLTARVSELVFIHPNVPEPRPSYIVARVTNVGILPLRIPLSFLMFKVPCRKTAWLMMTLDAFPLAQRNLPRQKLSDRLVPYQNYPVEIAPRANHSFYVGERETFLSSLYDNMLMKMKVYERVLFRFVRVTITSDDGMRFTAKIEKGVRQEFKRLAVRHPRVPN